MFHTFRILCFFSFFFSAWARDWTADYLELEPRTHASRGIARVALLKRWLELEEEDDLLFYPTNPDKDCYLNSRGADDGYHIHSREADDDEADDDDADFSFATLQTRTPGSPGSDSANWGQRPLAPKPHQQQPPLAPKSHQQQPPLAPKPHQQQPAGGLPSYVVPDGQPWDYMDGNGIKYRYGSPRPNSVPPAGIPSNGRPSNGASPNAMPFDFGRDWDLPSPNAALFDPANWDNMMTETFGTSTWSPGLDPMSPSGMNWDGRDLNAASPHGRTGNTPPRSGRAWSAGLPNRLTEYDQTWNSQGFNGFSPIGMPLTGNGASPFGTALDSASPGAVGPAAINTKRKRPGEALTPQKKVKDSNDQPRRQGRLSKGPAARGIAPSMPQDLIRFADVQGKVQFADFNAVPTAMLSWSELKAGWVVAVVNLSRGVGIQVPIQSPQGGSEESAGCLMKAMLKDYLETFEMYMNSEGRKAILLTPMRADKAVTNDIKRWLEEVGISKIEEVVYVTASRLDITKSRNGLAIEKVLKTANMPVFAAGPGLSGRPGVP